MADDQTYHAGVLNPVHLQTLVTVLRTGLFADAARELGYTSSAVSQQIAALERSLKITLFDRSARSISPTPAAMLLAERSRESLASLQSLQDDVTSLTAGQLGSLRVGSFPTASERLLPHTFRTFLSAYPQVAIRLDEAEPCELVLGLADGTVDVALYYNYRLAPRPAPADFVPEPLFEEDLVLLVPSSFQASPRGQWADYADATWIATRADTGAAESLKVLCAQEGFEPRITFRSNDYDVIKEFVSCGLGVALVPALTVALNHTAGVDLVSLPGTQRMRSITALHRGSVLNPVVPHFLAALKRTVCELAGGLPHFSLLA